MAWPIQNPTLFIDQNILSIDAMKHCDYYDIKSIASPNPTDNDSD